MTKDELRTRLHQIIKAKPTLSFELIDSVGTEKEGRDYHCSINLKNGRNEFTYDMIYKKEQNAWANKVNSSIELLAAFDLRDGTGGYKIESEGMHTLIEIFEGEIINKLCNNTSP
jgi:hypothetical protein